MTHYWTRLATTDDAPAIGQLLHAFNVEFDEATPGPLRLSERIAELVGAERAETSVVLGGRSGDQPDGLAVLRFRPAIWSPDLECYLAELYVTPERRGQGLGRAIMLAAMAHDRARGAGYMDLGTEEDDVAARHLYESLGFDNHNGRPDGPVSYCYAREL